MRTIVKWLAMATALAAGMSVQAALITNSFTTAEGFASGALNGQKGWITKTGSAWTVDPSGDGKVTVNSTWNHAVFNQAYTMSAGESLTFRTELKLLGTLVAPSTGSATLMQFGVRTDASTNNPIADHNTVLSAFATGNLILRGDNNGAPNATLGTIAANGTANLAVEYTLNVGASAAESTFSHKIINLDTLVQASASTNLDSTIYTALTSGGGVYSYLTAAGYNANSSGVTGIDVFSTTVIPEPATVGMLGLGALITLGLRRKLTL